MVLLIVILIIIGIIIEFIMSKLRIKYRDVFIDLLEQRKYDEFDDVQKDILVPLLIPKYTILTMKLNHAVANNFEEMIDDLFVEISTTKMNDRQKNDSLLRGFNYYLSLKDKDKCKYYYSEILESKLSEEIKEVTFRFYNVFIEKDTTLLETLIEELSNLDEINWYTNEYLIAEIYNNLGNSEKASFFKGQSKKHRKEFDDALKRADMKNKNEKKEE